jgi:hypothetical protein
MVRAVVLPDAVRHVQDRRKAGIVVYRDVLGRSSSSHSPSPKQQQFIPKVKVADREPGALFVAVDGNDSGVPVWVERALLSQLEEHESLHISVDRGLIKRLKVELGSEKHRQPGERHQHRNNNNNNNNHHQRRTGAVGAA